MKKYLKLIWLLRWEFITLIFVILALGSFYTNNLKCFIINMLFVLWICFERVIDILKDNEKLNK